MAMANRVHDSMAKEVASDKPMIIGGQRDFSSSPYFVLKFLIPRTRCCLSTRIIAMIAAVLRKERCEIGDKFEVRQSI